MIHVKGLQDSGTLAPSVGSGAPGVLAASARQSQKTRFGTPLAICRAMRVKDLR